MSRHIARALAALLVAGAALVAPGPSSPASAAPTDPIAVVVDGVGFGHGRGMSQWGAYGWAVDRERPWQWILDHYYGGTVLGDVDTSQTRLRVRLLGLDDLTTVGVTAGSGNVSVGSVSGRSMYARETSPNRFALYSATSMACPSSTSLVVPNGPVARGSSNSAAVRQIQSFLNAFRVAGDTTLAVDGDFGRLTEARVRDWQGDQGLTTNGVWGSADAARARQLIAGASSAATWTFRGTVTGPVTFTNPNGENSSASPTSVLGVCDSSGRITHYRGAIEVRSESSGNRVVNDVKTEDYLRGVVPKEISAGWADAGGGRGVNAVRAQAVAARSYGLQQDRYPYASICDSQSCQVYFGSASRASASSSAIRVEDPRTDAAIAATAGKVRKWPATGAIVSTEFSASNGPRTAGGVFPPVDDAGDSTANNPNHRWTRVLDADAIAARYGLGQLVSVTMDEAASTTNRQFDGIWFNDVVLTGTARTPVRVPAWDFRRTFGLPSPGFTVRTVARDTQTTSIGFIGDSVGNSIAGSSTSEFRTLIDGTFPTAIVDTVDGRCTITTTCPGTSGVQAAAALPFGLDLVVVELGYNDWPSTMPGAVDAMMAALQARGVGRVVWVNMADIRTLGGDSFYGPANAALVAARNRWANLEVADWNRASAAVGIERERWFTDGVHLSSTGQAEFALWLRQVAGASGAGAASGGGIDAPSHRFGAGQRIELPVVGETVVGPDGSSQVIPAGASAVALNITAVGPSAEGYMTVWPCEAGRPEASNLNFATGAVVANGVIAPVGASGTVCFYSNAPTDFLVDLAGWFSGSVGGLPTFIGATPKRVLDTRNAIGAPKLRVPAGGTITLPMAGAPIRGTDGVGALIPNNTTAVALNVTAVGPSQDGYFTIWPCGAARPEASNLNFTPGSVVANGVVASLGSEGAVCLYSNQESDVLVDVLGWFSAGVELAPYVGSVPTRLVDTRNGIGGQRGMVAPGTPKAVPVRGVPVRVNGVAQRVPSDATAVVLNVTMTETQGDGYATVWPCGTPRPEASNVNYVRGATVANGVVAPIGPDGSVCIYTFADSHLLVDLAGWFTGGGEPAFTGNNPKRLVDTRNSIGPTPI